MNQNFVNKLRHSFMIPGSHSPLISAQLLGGSGEVVVFGEVVVSGELVVSGGMVVSAWSIATKIIYADLVDHNKIKF